MAEPDTSSSLAVPAAVHALTRQARWSTVAVLLLAFVLRLWRLGAGSLWYDETVSVTLAGKDLAGLVAHTAGDIHPPGYYVLLYGWQAIAGRSDLAAAYMSAWFGLLLVPLAYWLARRLFGPRAALIAALLVAISPYNVWYSQEVRMYTLGAVLATVVVGAAIRYWQAAAAPGKVGAVALVLGTVAGALGLWTLYYFAFLLVAVNLLVIGRWLAGATRHPRQVSWRPLAWWLVAQGAALLLYLPWLPVAWRQATDPPVPPWRSFTGAWQVLVESWTALSLGQSAEPSWAWPALLVVAALVGLALWGRGAARGGGARARSTLGWAWFLLGCAGLPLVLIYVASLVTPLYHVRYLFTYSTPFYVVVAAGAARLWRRWALAGAAALAIVTLWSGASLVAYYTSPRYAADDHRQATAFLAEAWRPGDAIVVNAGYAYPALVTYWPATGGQDLAWRGRLVGSDLPAPDPCAGPALWLAGAVDGDPNLGWGDPASDFYAMSRQETEAALDRLFATYHRVWVYRIYDTVTDPEGLIRDGLDKRGVLFADQVFSGESQLRVMGYLTGRDALAGPCPMGETAMPMGDESLGLVGVTRPATKVEAGGALDMAFLWQVNAPLPDAAYLFAGLFDEQGERWAQVDEQPAGPLYRVTEWRAGQQVRTPLRLRVPASTPPGDYRVEMGWYRFEAGQPVWLPWPNGERLFVGQVRVTPPVAGWQTVPAPEPAHSAGVSMGSARLLGFDALALEGQPGESLALDLYWQGGKAADEPAPAVVRLVDGQGNVLGEWASAPAGGRAPFTGLAAGQVVRDPRSIPLPADAEPGLYTLEVGRRTSTGQWLAVRRGAIRLGSLYPLATVRVLGREMGRVPPVPQNPRLVNFGPAIRFLGHDLERGPEPRLVLYWQALAPMTSRYKIAVHLLGEEGPGDIRAQADVHPRLPTTSWLPGEYLADRVTLHPPAGGEPATAYTLWLALYEDTAGARLPVYDQDGALLGDGLVLGQVTLGE